MPINSSKLSACVKKPARDFPKSIIGIAFLILVGISVWPALAHGLVGSDDMVFHVRRTIQQLMNWKNGCALPQMYLADSGWELLGGAVNIFYPPLSVWTTAGFSGFFMLFGLPLERAVSLGYPAANVFMIALSAATMLWAAKRIFKSFPVAALCAAIYISSPYFLSDFYGRSAIGECMAFIFLPILALGIYSTFYDNGKYAFCLAIGASGLILSNLPLVNITGIFLVFFCILNFKKLANKKIIKILAINLALTALLTAFYWGPCIWEGLRKNLAFPPDSYLLLFFFGLTPEHLYSPTGKLNHNIMTNFSLPMIFWAMICCLFRKHTKKSLPLTAGFAISIALSLGCVYSPDYYPWLVSALGKILRYQFSMRVLVIAILLGALLAGFNALSILRKPKYSFWAILLTIAACCASDIFYLRQWDHKMSMAEVINNNYVIVDYAPRNAILFHEVDLEKSGKSIKFPVAKEYKYLHSPRENLIATLAGSAKIADPIRMGCGMRFQVETGPSGATLELPFLDYTGYEATLVAGDEKTRLAQGDAPNGLITLLVPPNATGEIKLAYKTPLWQKMLNWLSFLTLPLFLLVWRKKWQISR